MLFERDFSEVDRHLGNGMADGRHNTPKSKRIYSVGEMPAFDLLRQLLNNSTVPVRTPAQIAAEALRIEHMERFGQDFPCRVPCITVSYTDGDCEARAACYSDESAAAMVKAFDGEITSISSPRVDAALGRLIATTNQLFKAIDAL
jgi:hypothetical protein